MLGGWLQIVAAETPYQSVNASPCKEAFNYNSIGISDQERAGKNGTGFDGRWRFDDSQPLAGKGDGGQLLADAFHPRVVSTQEERDIGAQL
jgi:hypothetical protein